jgi:flagellar biosynthesis chaperone FliJ
MSFHYRYPLQTLKTRRTEELEAAQVALGLAQAEVDDAQRQVASAETTMRDLEDLLRRLQCDGTLDLDRRRLAHNFLHETRSRAEALRGVLDTLIEKRSDCVNAVKLGKTALRSLERHEERLSARALVEYTRRDQREGDDGWVMVAMRRKREMDGRA